MSIRPSRIHERTLGGDLSPWLVTEYQWPSEANNEQFQRLSRNKAYLRAVGANIINDSVDAWKGDAMYWKQSGGHPRDVALVVWGSPCNDTASGDHRSDASVSPSNEYKAEAFASLCHKFPYASIVLTCTRCSPPIKVEHTDRPMLRVPCRIHSVEDIEGSRS